MTPKEKAQEIFDEMKGHEGIVYTSTARSIATFCAEQCKEAAPESLKDFWLEVIAEIEKL